ncbi:MAG: polysaccharide deacetylase family protein, partial [Elusimicrobia bacterium]|nr:polysaccharide deacetylase family protein [Elusimicrobiota bacterium]
MTLTTAAAAAAGLGVLGASTRWNWWRLPKKGIPVLLYHRIGNPPAGSCQKSLWVNTKRFDWQMGYLQDYGYTSVNFHDLAQGRLPMKPVIITFDDGYLNQYTGAYPVLKRRGMTGVFYIVADAVGKENSWHDTEEEPRQMLMSLDIGKSVLVGLTRKAQYRIQECMLNLLFSTLPMEEEIRHFQELIQQMILIL